MDFNFSSMRLHSPPPTPRRSHLPLPTVSPRPLSPVAKAFDWIELQPELKHHVATFLPPSDKLNLRASNPVGAAEVNGAIESLKIHNREDIPAALKTFQAVKTLDVSECMNLSDSDLEIIGKQHQLENLKLSGNFFITKAGVAHLQNLTQLRSIELRNIDMRDGALAQLKDLEKITSIKLYNCENITDDDFKALTQLPKLETLVIANSHNFSGSGLAALKNSEVLKELELHSCHGLTAEGMASFTGTTALKKLDISENPQLTDEHVSPFTSSVQLRDVKLGTAPQLTNAALTTFAGAEDLEHFDLQGSRLIDDIGMQSINFTKLKSLNVQGCTDLTHETTNRLNTAPALEELNVAHCLNIADQHLNALRNRGVDVTAPIPAALMGGHMGLGFGLFG